MKFSKPAIQVGLWLFDLVAGPRNGGFALCTVPSRTEITAPTGRFYNEAFLRDTIICIHSIILEL